MIVQTFIRMRMCKSLYASNALWFAFGDPSHSISIFVFRSKFHCTLASTTSQSNSFIQLVWTFELSWVGIVQTWQTDDTLVSVTDMYTSCIIQPIKAIKKYCARCVIAFTSVGVWTIPDCPFPSNICKFLLKLFWFAIKFDCNLRWLALSACVYSNKSYVWFFCLILLHFHFHSLKL